MEPTGAAAAAAGTAMAAEAGGGRHLSVSWDEIKAVQNLIERCLQQYMTQTEIIAALQVQANIEPSLTVLVWQKLEEQNPDFFFSYDVKLRLKDQIVAFNYLVEQQYRLLQKLTLAVPGQQAAAADPAQMLQIVAQQQAQQQQVAAQQQQLAQQQALLMQQQQQLAAAPMAPPVAVAMSPSGVPGLAPPSDAMVMTASMPLPGVTSSAMDLPTPSGGAAPTLSLATASAPAAAAAAGAPAAPALS